ncbi:hypothetical protein MAPG_06977 [Magnaporthiopsis poae ATCC 64411]|uniref:Uncharacterized protein n=1 Tax=Magnaporthiopsis poae (strain ATCC 64411 / 73-15) TaxID=644358 RepID=A0A0C4E3H8_MAGP6|nr:hypothetical protein MAPG_06977 [Magnaporthiopsis poae ATCC 64411]
MEGLALAAAVVQFVEFTTKIVTKGIAIHQSVTGKPVDHEELEAVTKSLASNSKEIEKTMSIRRQDGQPAEVDQDLQTIATGCQDIAKELLSVLDGLAAKKSRTPWRSFRHALQATWNEGKVKSLEERLDRYRQQMMAVVLSSLMRQAELLIQGQYQIRESIEEMNERTRNTVPVGDQFVRQLVDGDTWRREVVRMIHERRRELQKPNTHLNSTTSDGGESAPTDVVIQQRILRKLAFRNMADRERRISKAYERTFEWIFADPMPGSRPWSSFKAFLGDQSKSIYWITGKPGSGKSTLMKYIRQQSQTTQLLQAWSGDAELIQAAFYFWNSGSQMQMTVDGLLRTVLHDCLKQLPPSTAQRLLPERWEAATLFEDDDFPWSWEETSQALGTLVTEVHPEIRFFLMIDGLDECSGNQTELIELITELTDQASNLKCCLASRPWNNFEDAFRRCPSLRVQDLTAPDIAHFIDSKFRSNSGFLEFQTRAPSQAQTLVKDIATKAEGVFLWVLLVVRSLLEGLTDGDSVDDLHERLEELPPTLEELYAKILKGLREKHLDHASRIFQIVKVSLARPLLVRIALADLEDGSRAMRAPVEPLSPEETYALCRSMKRKLVSRCRGLLEVSSPDDYKSLDDPENHEPDLLDPHHGVHGELSPTFEVQYLHRTVKDYIQSSAIWPWLLSANREPFDPHLSLMKSHLLSLKMPWYNGLNGRNITWLCITHAKLSLDSQSSQAAGRKEVLLLLDELDRTVTSYCDAFSDGRWSAASCFFPSTWPSSFAHLMAACGIHQYLEARFFDFDLMEEQQKEGGIDITTPLLIAAIDDQLTWNFPHVGSYLDGPHEKVVAALLDMGADCHGLYDGRSAWDVAERQGNVGILALFEKHCGPKPEPGRRRAGGTEHSGDATSFDSPS